MLKTVGRTNFLITPFAYIALFSLAAIFGLSCSTGPPSKNLHTSGSKILDASNQVVGLSGLNWFGFETANNAPYGLEQRAWEEVLDQIKALGYNVIRIPFSNAMLEPGAAPAKIDYNLNPDLAGLTSLQVLDKIISGAGERGLKVILD